MLYSKRRRRALRAAGRQVRTELFVAVVHAADGLRLMTVAESRAELMDRLAEYVRRRAVHVLDAKHARHVRGLLARGELEAAVETYFGLVGARWDEEWLVTAALARDGCWDGRAAVDAIAEVADTMSARTPRSADGEEVPTPASIVS